VVTSINEGKPFVLYNAQTVIARQINRLAMEMLGREGEPADDIAVKSNGSFLKKLFK
jgi:MinD-like ATPase involved in chromosome partitioning or flagellar assembly